MIAIGMDEDNIRFYVITKAGEQDWLPMHKTLFIASIDNVLQKKGL